MYRQSTISIYSQFKYCKLLDISARISYQGGKASTSMRLWYNYSTFHFILVHKISRFYLCFHCLSPTNCRCLSLSSSILHTCLFHLICTKIDCLFYFIIPSILLSKNTHLFHHYQVV